MNRYLYTGRQINNKKALKKTIYPNFDGDDYFYVNVNTLNRLDKLAYKYYNDESLYWFIAITNNLPADSILIGESMKIKIYNNVESELSKMRD